jgi:hypothetical protein
VTGAKKPNTASASKRIAAPFLRAANDMVVNLFGLGASDPEAI